MKKELTATLLLSISVHFVSAQWVVQPRVSTAILYQLKFIDRNNGWAAGVFRTLPSNSTQSSIQRTTDAGNSWSERLLNNCSIYGLEFVDHSVGWAVGEAASGKSIIYKTDDAGGQWYVVDSSAITFGYRGIKFLDKQHGWIWTFRREDTAGVVLRTSDGGASWQSSYDKSLRVNDLWFLNALKGWAVGENGKIYKTTDGGATWVAVFQAPYPNDPQGFEPLRRIRFADPMQGCAVGGISGVETKVWTSDGGVSWNVSDKTGGSSLHGLWFADANNGWCVGGNNAGLTIQKTSDGGKTWASQLIPTFPAVVPGPVFMFHDIAFVSPSEGWIVADNGFMLKTTSAGEPVITLMKDQDAGASSAFQLCQNYPNPFNPTTTIEYNLAKAANVSLKVFNIMGQEIAILANERQDAGLYTVQWKAVNIPSDIYFYRLQAGDFVATKAMILLK